MNRTLNELRVTLVIRKVVVACSLSTVMAFSAAAQADGTMNLAEMTSQVRAGLKKIYGSNEQLVAAGNKLYGTKLSPDKEAITVDYLQRTLFNPAMTLYVAQLMLPLYSETFTAAQAVSAVAEGVATMQVKGVLRLSADKQAAFLTHLIDMGGWMSSKKCRDLYEQRIGLEEASTLERQFIAQLPARNFAAIHRLYLDAVEAELNDYPSPRTISSAQAKLADAAWHKSVQTRLPAKVPASVLARFNQGPSSALDADVCMVTNESIAAMLDISEPYRSWALIRFLESVQ